MKKLTIILKDESAIQQFNDIMYSLPKHEDGSGMCTQAQAIEYALTRSKQLDELEEKA